MPDPGVRASAVTEIPDTATPLDPRLLRERPAGRQSGVAHVVSSKISDDQHSGDGHGDDEGNGDDDDGDQTDDQSNVNEIAQAQEVNDDGNDDDDDDVNKAGRRRRQWRQLRRPLSLSSRLSPIRRALPHRQKARWAGHASRARAREVSSCSVHRSPGGKRRRPEPQPPNDKRIVARDSAGPDSSTDGDRLAQKLCEYKACARSAATCKTGSVPRSSMMRCGMP